MTWSPPGRESGTRLPALRLSHFRPPNLLWPRTSSLEVANSYLAPLRRCLPLMMRYDPSEIEALLQEVQGGVDDIHHYHERAAGAPLPYTRPDVPAYVNPAVTQHRSSHAHLHSRGQATRQPLYESQNLQSTSAFTAPNTIYGRASNDEPTRGLYGDVFGSVLCLLSSSSSFIQRATPVESW